MLIISLRLSRSTAIEYYVKKSDIYSADALMVSRLAPQYDALFAMVPIPFTLDKNAVIKNACSYRTTTSRVTD